MHFGSRLKKYRIENGLTREKVGELCGISPDTVKGLEKSRTKPSYAVIIKICNGLNVSPAYLMQDDLSIITNDVGESAQKNEIIKIIDNFSPKQLDLLVDLLRIAKMHYEI